MSRPRLGRRVTAVFVAVLVVCSFVGAPVAVAAASSSSLTSELASNDGTLSSSTSDSGGSDDADDSDGSDDSGGTDDADGSDDIDDAGGADGTEDSDGSDDAGGADDTDDSDGSDDADDSDGAADSDGTADSDGSDGADGASDADDTDDSDDGDGHLVRSGGSGDSGGSSSSDDADSTDRTSGDDEPRDRSVGDRLAGTVEETVESVEETTGLETDEGEASAGDALERFEPPLVSPAGTAAVTLEETTSLEDDGAEGNLVLTVFQLAIETGGSHVFGTSGGDQADVDPPLRDAASTGSEDVESVGQDDPVPAEVSVAGGTDEDDDPAPSPPEPSGGAVVGLGALAAAAAVRKTPMVAAATPWTNLTGWLGSMLARVSPFLVGLRYSRYDDSDPLEHDARERVYEIVTEAPGSYLSQVSEEADLPLSTTRHHVKVLQREDLVSGAKLRGKRRFYPAYAEGIELAAALNDEATTGIIDAIARLGAASVSDLATELDRDPSTISHHLQRLEADDIIRRERDGRTVMNTLSPEARTALEPDTTQKTDRPTEVATTGAD